MATTLSPSGLKYSTTSDSDIASWNAHWTDNWTLLNGTLLKLRNLLDVDDTGISDDDVLAYNSSSGKWEPHAAPAGKVVTTTTTTTTTTSTSTTTTTTTT